MIRKLELKEVVRLLQHTINTHVQSGTEIGYAQAQNLLVQFEGFEGFRQWRKLVSTASNFTAFEGTIPPPEGYQMQSLAMFLHGHCGFEGGKVVHAKEQPRVIGVRNTQMYNLGPLSIPPSFHYLEIECREGLMIAADYDAGEQYPSGLNEDDVLLRYVGRMGEFNVTWAQLKQAKYIRNNIWVLNGVELAFIVEADAIPPSLARSYKPKPGEFLTQTEFENLCRELESLEMGAAKGQDQENTYTRMAEIEVLLQNSPWAIDMDTGKTRFKSELYTDAQLSQKDNGHDLPF